MRMRRIVYTGPAHMVHVPALRLRAARDEPVSVPWDVARELIARGTWQPASRT